MQSSSLEYKGTDRPNIVITLLAGSFSFGAWALIEIANRIREASRDTQNLLTAVLAVAGVITVVASIVFFSTTPRSRDAAPKASSALESIQPPSSPAPAGLLTLSAVEPTISPTLDIEKEIKGLRREIIETKKELREARKTVPEDVSELESDLNGLEVELKELQQMKSTGRKAEN